MDGEPIEEDVLLLEVVVERIVLRGLQLYVERGQERREAFDVGCTVACHQSHEGIGEVAEALDERRCVGVAGGNYPHVAGMNGEARCVVVADGVQGEHLRAIRLLIG